MNARNLVPANCMAGVEDKFDSDKAEDNWKTATDMDKSLHQPTNKEVELT